MTDINILALTRLQPVRSDVDLHHLTPRSFDRFELIGGAPGIHLGLDDSGFPGVREMYERYHRSVFTALVCRLDADGLFVPTIDLWNWSSTALYLIAAQAGALSDSAWLSVEAGTVSALCDNHSWSTLRDILELGGAPIRDDERGAAEELKADWSRRGWLDALYDRDRSALSEMLRALRMACPILSAQMDLFFLPPEFLESVRRDLSGRLMSAGLSGFTYKSASGNGDAILVVDPSAIRIVSRQPMTAAGTGS
jgi:hypothetical protein